MCLFKYDASLMAFLKILSGITFLSAVSGGINPSIKNIKRLRVVHPVCMDKVQYV